MSTLSPQLVQNESPTDVTFYDSTYHDPYLSAPLDPDEASFKSSAIRLTPVSGEDHGTGHPSSPLNIQTHSDMVDANNGGRAASYSEFLSPTEDFSSDMSAHTSPSADILSAGFSMDMELGTSGLHRDNAMALDVPDIAPEAFSAPAGEISSPSTMLPPQPASLNQTSSPGLLPDLGSITIQAEHETSARQPQALSLITSPPSDNLSVHAVPDSARARSPIVKIESYSRGDSPVRDASLTGRRRSLSSTHLSPNDMTSESEPDGLEEEYRGGGLNYTVTRTQDGSWIPNMATGQAGVGPSSREDIYVMSPNDMETQRQLYEKNADIQSWSVSVSAANSEAGDDDTSLLCCNRRHMGGRRRAKSAGDPSLQQDYFNLKSRLLGPAIPGPGLLLHESSDDEISDGGSEGAESRSDSPAVSVNAARWAQGDTELAPAPEQSRPEDEEPSPHQFLGAPPWRDSAHDPSPRATRMQPSSSSAAMVEYQRRAKDIDTASRSATWGTRHLNDADVNSIIGPGGSFETLSISNDKSKKHERRSSLRKFLHRKPSSSNLKRRLSDLSIIPPSTEGASKGDEVKSPPVRKDSFPHRLSLGRSRSPSLSTGGAVIAIAGQMAAIGGKDSLRAASPNSATGHWPHLKVRGRSRSELPRASAPGLIDLMTSHGGPPVPNIAYSPRAIDHGEATQKSPEVNHAVGHADDEDDDIADEKGLVMQFPVPSHLPVPTLEGFRNQITQLNPRLPPALIDRFSHEQLRRYRKLVESKQSHTRAVSQRKCPSGNYCFALGGEAKLLAPRASPEAAHTQFHIPGHGEVDDDPHKLGESAVTAAQFPPGVPLPPVKRLPAEFECPVCFQVKKFQKPSDWTKHVHEDVQPFTCTFPHCSDPKSFKRKADWVRHESERHRQLEWWTCTVPDCHHTCYRKDNFVQHLVREHKMPEPKVKKAKSQGSASKTKGDPVSPDLQEENNREREIEQLWDLVERCRHDTLKGPKDEPCRFCGNVCSSWKKLTVHLAKHMEQIAMPVLALVNERDLSSNETTGPTSGGPDVGPDPGTSTPEASRFMPRLDGVEGSSAVSTDLTQAPYASNNAERLQEPMMSFNPSYPPHLTTMPGGWISAEPESIDAYDDAPAILPGGAVDQTRLMPIHQNSVTYPPPFNAGPRLRVPNQNLSVLQDPYSFAMSPTEMQPAYDHQGPVYVSPSAENGYGYQGSMPQAMPYVPGGYRE
ncbi:C2H2 finger domain protein [Aspergillus sclerotiicarbonarius CBS 121057]|uniref:C2H2 finger domain protein n=1 Tax=Aspergillus sclerotiicarbonarius (strain CBS 121057 / IBT 28362) TaxID=1448318 RepID=A0A319E8R4_ASPSB|nr:C2H2 finger domain protein [Aspergillus sclerotiicarbonarius CBS 121057]